MPNEFKYTLTFSSVATGTGAQVAAAGAERVRAAVDGMGDKARVASWAHYDLDAAMKSAGKSSETLTPGITAVGKSSRNSAQALLMFSQGFEDAQYGMRGVLNNIPSLVMSLGGTAGLTAAISIAAVSFSVLYDWLSKTGETMGSFKADLSEVAANSGKLIGEDWDRKLEAIDTAKEKAEALNQKWVETGKAENAAAVSALDNAAKVAEAQQWVNEQLGEQVDKYKEIQRLADEAEAKRVLQAQQEADAAAKAAAAAAEKAQQLSDELGYKRAMIEEEKMFFADQSKTLDQIRERYAEVKRLASAQVAFKAEDYYAMTGQYGGQPREDYQARREARDDARLALRTVNYPVQIDSAQSRLDETADKIKSLEKATTNIGIALDKAVTAADDEKQATITKLETIQSTLTDTNLTAKKDELEATAKEFADDLKSTVDSLQPQLETGKKAKQQVEQILSDGKITAQETEDLQRNLTTLIGGLQSGVTSGNKATAELIKIMFEFQTMNAAMDADIARLNRKMTAQKSRAATPNPAY